MPGYDLSMAGNDLYIDDGAGGSFLAIEGGAGTILTISGAEKGGKDLGSRSFAFGHRESGGTGLLLEFGVSRRPKAHRGRARWQKFFRDRELFVPMHLFDSLGGRNWLVLEGVEAEQVARLDVLAPARASSS